MANPTTTTTTTSPFTTTQDMGKHPNQIPNPHHRKIDLQSHADLTYLQTNLALAARDKLDIYFPRPAPKPIIPKSAPPATIISLDGPRESLPQQSDTNTNTTSTTTNQDDEMDVDPLRAPVTILLDSFLRETYTSAVQNITVNGIDASHLPPSKFPVASTPAPDTEKETQPPDVDQEIEGIHYTYAPFDRKLQKRMQALYEEVETLTGQVASLRRETPRLAAGAYVAGLDDVLGRDEEAWEVERRRLDGLEYEGLKLDAVREGWNGDVRRMYGRGTNDLAVLSGLAGRDAAAPGVAGLTETVGKVERARNVVTEFE